MLVQFQGDPVEVEECECRDEGQGDKVAVVVVGAEEVQEWHAGDRHDLGYEHGIPVVVVVGSRKQIVVAGLECLSAVTTAHNKWVV